MRTFEYERPGTIAETVALLERDQGRDGDRARLIAGGTDLLTLMKADLLAPSRLIDIKRLADLDDVIELNAGDVTIGALATLTEIERDPVVRATHPALVHAAAAAASPQLRNMATIGGNLLQRPRCWYFRDSEVRCWLKGGDGCPAVDGENQHLAIFNVSPCHAVHPSDLATALLALDASLTIRSAHGERTVRLEDFFTLPTDDHRIERSLEFDEIIVSVTIPTRSATAQSVYLKAMDRQAWAFALVGAGVRLDVQSGVITDARLALGGVAPIPWRVPDAEALLIGSAPSADLFERAAELALAGASPLSGNGYKAPLAKTLIRRALTAAAIPNFEGVQ